MRLNTKTVAGIITLASLVVVFDYTLKYSGLKIPFPWLPFLKFDFTGVPIVLSLLLFGFIPGTFTSAIASLAILARSGAVVGSVMKGLAEFSTIIGMFLGLKLAKRFKLPISFSCGIATRVILMTFANLTLIYMGLMKDPLSYNGISSLFILLTGVFNVIQGAVSILCGYLIYMAIKRRIPALAKSEE